MAMIPKSAEVVWRVRAQDDSAHASAFDALVLPTDAGARAGPEDAAGAARLLGAAVPYEAELPDAPLVLVVQSRAGTSPLIVEYESFGPDGSRQVYGRGSHPLVVIVRTTSGIMIGGLPPGTAEPPALAP
jgi:hypothetical protein